MCKLQLSYDLVRIDIEAERYSRELFPNNAIINHYA
jgi:hypothetical protein